MGLILKSNGKYSGPELAVGYNDYVERVLSDGGEIISTASVASALLFASARGINSDNCFSATAAAWGVKRSGGNVEKLYSLFGQQGDIISEGGDYPFAVVDGIPTVYSPRASSHELRSVGTTVSERLAIISISKTIFNSNNHLIGSFVNTSDLSGLGRALTVVALQSEGSYLIDAISSRLGSITVERPYSPWDGVGAFLTENGYLSLLASGQVIGTDPSTSPRLWDENRLYIASSGYGLSNGQLGNIAEFWALTDAEDSQVLAVSARSLAYPSS